MRPYLAIFKSELKMFIREPFAFFFTLIFPVGLTLLIGFAYGHEVFEEGYNGADLALPINFSFLIANLGLMAVPQFITEQRRTGVLKRFLVLPLSRSALLIGTLSVNFLMCLISGTLIFLTGLLLFGAGFYGNIFEVIVTVFLGITAFFLLGYLIALIPTTPRTTQLVATALFFSMLFFSGVIIPISDFPVLVQNVVKYFPMTNLVELFQASWLNTESIFGMTRPLLNLLILIGLCILYIHNSKRSFEHRQN